MTYEIILDALKTHDGPRGKDGRSYVRTDPMRVLFGCPAINKESDWHEKGSRDHNWDTVFWSPCSSILFREISISSIEELSRGL